MLVQLQISIKGPKLAEELLVLLHSYALCVSLIVTLQVVISILSHKGIVDLISLSFIFLLLLHLLLILFIFCVGLVYTILDGVNVDVNAISLPDLYIVRDSSLK